MIVIPIHKKIDWKHPPLITLFLLIVNVAVFLLFQLDDDQETAAALEYYQASGLAETEFQPYKDFVAKQEDMALYLELKAFDETVPPFWVWSLQSDAVFLQALHNGDVILPGATDLEMWRNNRATFETLFEEITFVKYGLRTAEPEVLTLFTHMFLHAGVAHLLGNMLFLVALGLLVELTMSRPVFLLCYLMGGLCSVAFNFLFEPLTLTPGIGASGAIAGLMGAYTVLYGLQKVRFFYFIGVYFDYVKSPAIVLLPMWVGNEVLQMALYPDSNINFMAHLGGLVSGAFIALLVRRYATSYTLDHMEKEEAEDNFQAKLGKALAIYNRMDYEKALPLFRQLYQQDSQHRQVLVSYYNCCKMYPMRDEYHSLARAILMLKENDPGTNDLVLETFNEYLKLAKPKAKLNETLICKLATRFVKQQAVDEAGRLIRLIVVNQLRCSHRGLLLERFAILAKAKGRYKAYARYLELPEKPKNMLEPETPS